MRLGRSRLRAEVVELRERLLDAELALARLFNHKDDDMARLYMREHPEVDA